jgi:hypothetical protein
MNAPFILPDSLNVSGIDQHFCPAMPSALHGLYQQAAAAGVILVAFWNRQSYAVISHTILSIV